MTLRTKSKVQQWTVWMCAALAVLAVYVVLSRIIFDSVTWDLSDYRLHQLVVPLSLFFFTVTWNTRWDGVKREEKAEDKKVKVEGQDEVEKVSGGGDGIGRRSRSTVVSSSDSADRSVDVVSCRVRKETGASSLTRQDAASTEETVHCQPQLSTSTSFHAGEELFNQARALPHRIVPDLDNDGEYLELLAKSAASGYPPALAKLGEYAMRRAAWVEAYYWMRQAQRNGMQGLSPTLREIRKNWSQAGFPDQSSNFNRLFNREAGSIGRALLHVDSGHGAATAREFLKEHHPEYLTSKEG